MEKGETIMKKLFVIVFATVLVSCGISQGELSKVKNELQKHLESQNYNVTVVSLDVKKQSGDYVGNAIISYSDDEQEKQKTISVKASPFLFDTFLFDVDKKVLDSINPDAWKKEDRSFYAKSYIEGLIKTQLKSPSTAKFPGTLDTDYVIRQLDDQMYVVSSWVDSQNSFGAMIRTKYLGSVQQVAKEKWEVIDLEILE
jgi:galactitol-specific phosphotransferase system IIB component